MSEIFGLALSFIAYAIALKINEKTKLAILNPLLVSAMLIILTLLLLDIPYSEYNKGGAIINMLLLPATASLALNIYEKLHILKKEAIPILIGTSLGSLTSITSVYLLSKLFKLDEIIYKSLFAKSVTTPIAVSITEANEGIAAITVFAVIVTGITGAVIAPKVIKIFKFKDKTAIGLAIGTASHAMGTSKALEIGETEGAMSGLAIGVVGLITTLFSLFLL